MKISVQWLRELVTVDAPTAELARRLTAAGLEVEAITRTADFSGVVVATVRGKRPHPRSDHLTLVDVDDGSGQVTQVVCGASNVPEPGAQVVWGRPGARLPDGRVLTPKEIRGISSPGMLCAEDELGLGEGHEGIIILDEPLAPGADFAAWIGDEILEVNVTPNRPDCLGHLGIARDLAALLRGEGARLRRPSGESGEIAGVSDVAARELARVSIEDPSGCPRYLARVLTGLRVGPSPLRLRQRLRALGVRPISNAVDATNLALLEVGHPLHAFDLDKLAGQAIVVRRPRPGEVIVTLDDIERRLDPDDVVICDAERPVALAGVMGGAGTGVTGSTTRVLLESAYFDPSRIRRTAKRVGLHTEASHRFERGADPNAGLHLGSARCAQYLVELCGATLASGSIDVYPTHVSPTRVSLRPARVERVLGTRVPAEEQRAILESLELVPEVSDAGAPPDALHVEGATTWRVPTFRPDLTREIDLIEEIARVWGYDRVPSTLHPTRQVPPAPPRDLGEAVRDAMRGLGLVEMVSYGFTAPERIAAMGWPEGDRRARPIRLANPLGEEVSAMRTSLVPGLLATLEQNLARGSTDVRLFEVGAVFLGRDGATGTASERALPDEPQHVAGVMAGEREGWLKSGGALDFFDIKGIVEALLVHLGAAGIAWRPLSTGDAPWLHPGVSAAVTLGDAVIGVLGEVHPDLRRRLGIEVPAFAFELAIAPLGAAPRPVFRDLPRYPGSARDLSFFVDAGVAAAEVSALIAGASPLIESVRVLEDYREAGRVPAGRKGMLWSIFYRSRERTLTDDEVNAAHAAVVAVLRERFAIEQR